MKKLLISAIIALFIMIPSIVNIASATNAPIQQQTHFWKCKASSGYAWGVGIHGLRNRAAYIALLECAKRTPANNVCTIDWCVFR